MSRHTASQYVVLQGPTSEMELEVVVTFEYQRGCAPHYGSPSYGGDPGAPDSVEIIKLKVYEAAPSARNKRGAELDLTPWLQAFIEATLDTDELIAEAKERIF